MNLENKSKEVRVKPRNYQSHKGEYNITIEVLSTITCISNLEDK